MHGQTPNYSVQYKEENLLIIPPKDLSMKNIANQPTDDTGLVT